MTSPIDPIRRGGPVRRTSTSESDSSENDVDNYERLLPVPVDAAPSRPPPKPPASGAAAIAAQLLGQEGRRRGLRGGPAVLDAARSSYARAEWSGGADRRRPKGQGGETEV
jgi:hypothetical protein